MNTTGTLSGAAMTALWLIGANAHTADKKQADFGKLAGDQTVGAITLKNHKGVSATAITLGYSNTLSYHFSVQ
jgi:hypothetical protein